MTLTGNPRHDSGEASDPSQGPPAQETPKQEAEQMSQAERAAMHPELHEIDWRYYQNALQM